MVVDDRFVARRHPVARRNPDPGAGVFISAAMAKGLHAEAEWASALPAGSRLIYTQLPGTGCPGSRKTDRARMADDRMSEGHKKPASAGFLLPAIPCRPGVSAGSGFREPAVASSEATADADQAHQ